MHEIPIKTGVCLPDSCDDFDVKQSVSDITNLLYDLPLLKQVNSDIKLTALKCKSEKSELSFLTILFIGIVSIYLLLPLIGSLMTSIKYISEHMTSVKSSSQALNYVTAFKTHDFEASANEEPYSFEREECEDDQLNFLKDKRLSATNSNYKGIKCILQKIEKILNCFCIFTNAAQILNTSSSKKQFPCLHGVKFFSMTWVILGHTYVHNINYIDNYIDLLKSIDNLPFQVIMQGTFSVDSFFLIGGFLLGYLYLEEADKRNGKISWLGLCCHRFIRITPVYAFLIGFTSLIFKFLGSGPFWEETEDVVTCKQYWWWNVLYINNFLPMNSMCLTWTWYLSNDMQFFIISSLILYVLWRWKYVGVGIFSVLLVFSWILTWYLSYIYDIPPLFLGINEVKNITDYQGKLILAWDILYSKPYCRIGPHIIGILLAYYIYCNTDKMFVMNIGIQAAGWCIATFCSASVIYGLYHTHPHPYFLHSYNAFGRSAFSLGLAWLIFCCLKGYGGFINDFLSFKLWIPLSRLTYCAYLFHPVIMNWYFQSLRVPLFFTHSTMIFLFFSFLFISYSVAFIISILFEAPLINLEKIVFQRW